MFRTSLFSPAFCLLFLCLFNYNCTKIDNTNIGASLLPAVDNITTFDTLIPVIANNFDTVECTKIYPVDDHVLGYISNDPYFGTTTAAVFLELKPGVFPFTFPAAPGNMTLDSAVLVLSYAKTYGDSTQAQKVNVYQVGASGIVFDSSTSSCSTQSYDQGLLGSATYISQNFKDSISGFNERYANQLRIKLDNTFFNNFLTKDSTVYKSDSLFKVFFKGFAIIPDVTFGGNALTYYNLLDTNTKLALYYKYPVNSVDTTVVTNFRVTASSVSANNITHNRNGAEITSHLKQPVTGDDVIYIQTTPGSYAQLKIPGITGLSNRIVHRAEITMEQVYSPLAVDQYLTAPNLLYLDFKSDSTRRPIPCDFNILSGQPNFSSFGGFKTKALDFAGNLVSKYTFDVSRYVQKIITNGSTNYTLTLSAPDYIVNHAGYTDDCGQVVSAFNYFVNSVSFGRVKLGGGNNLNYQMKLRIIYSKI